MTVIPARIAEIVLTVIDNRIVPVRYIDSAIRANFGIDRSEIGVLGLNNRLENIGAITRSIFDEFITHHSPAFESTGQKLTLNFIGEMGARHQIAATLLLCGDKRRYPRSLLGGARTGSQIHNARIIHHK